MKSIILTGLLFCIPMLTLYAQNAPVMTARSMSTSDTTAIVSLTAVDFTYIVSCILQLKYDPDIATVKSVTVDTTLKGNMDVDLSVPGKIALGWYTYPAKTISGNPVLFNIAFKRVKVGTSQVTWYDTASTCIWHSGDYSTLIDTPSSAFYINGSLTFLAGMGISPEKENGNNLDLSCAPNPFSGNAKLSWVVPSEGNVMLEIFNLSGEKIRTIISEEEQPGQHTLDQGSAELVKGIYLARIILKKKNEIVTKSIKIISN